MILSIVTITFNNKSGLLKTLNSIDSKNSDFFEIIIVDNNSTDGTKDLVNYFKTKFINLIHVEEPDQGIYDAMNKGINAATGEYVIFMNAGDSFFERSSLREIIGTCMQKRYDFIYGNYYDEKSSRLKKARSAERISSGMFTSHQAMVYKLSLVKDKNLKFNLEYPLAADLLFTYEFIKSSSSNHFLNKTIARFEEPITSRFTLRSLLENHAVRIKHFDNSLGIDFMITILHLIKNIVVKIL